MFLSSRTIRLAVAGLIVSFAVTQTASAQHHHSGSPAANAAIAGAAAGAAAAATHGLLHWLSPEQARGCWQYRNCGIPPWANGPGSWNYGATPQQTIWVVQAPPTAQPVSTGGGGGQKVVKTCRPGDKLLPNGLCEHKGPAATAGKAAPPPQAAPTQQLPATITQSVDPNGPGVKAVTVRRPFKGDLAARQSRCYFNGEMFVLVADDDPKGTGFCADGS